MARLVVLEGDHNCINHATGGDNHDLSVEELRLLCQKYYDDYDAVRVVLPNAKEKAFSYTSPVIHPNSPPPPPIRHNYRLLGRVVKEIVLYSSQHQPPSYSTATCNNNQVEDVIIIDNDDDNNDNDDDVKEDVVIIEDDFVESGVVSSVASNDYVPQDDIMDQVQSPFACDLFGFTSYS